MLATLLEQLTLPLLSAEQRPLWVYGLPASSHRDVAALLQLSPPMQTTRSVYASTPWRAYQSFGALSSLLETLLPIVSEEAPSLLEVFRPAIQEAMPHLVSTEGSTRLRPADAIVNAVIRRISRESHHTALVIHDLARFLLEATRQCPSLRSAILIVISDFQYWDRPSIRVLYRLSNLQDSGDCVRWVALVNSWQPGGRADLLQRLERARTRFVEGLGGEGGAIEVRLGNALAANVNESTDGLSQEASLHDVAEALTDQNYERAYLLCSDMLDRAPASEQHARIWRLVALADANCRAFEDSLAALDEALRYTSQPPFRAHLRYLQGLLSTKRFYNLESADGFYRLGERELEEMPDDDPEVRLERAWLWNGLALNRALEAKEQRPQAEAASLLDDSMRLEFQAYRLVSKDRGPAFSYLRYNLMANITFLLEISRRYTEAVDFWRRAFETHLTVGNPAFQLAFDTRLGLLLARAGRMEEGEQMLTRAYRQADGLRDPFYQERIGYSLGFVQFHAGRVLEAARQFSAGLRQGLGLRLWRNAAEHQVALLHCAIHLGDAETVALLLDLGSRFPLPRVQQDSHMLRDRTAVRPLTQHDIEQVGVRLRPPSPKLPAYIPDVDLEGAPEHDLNRVLTDEKPHELRSRNVPVTSILGA